MPQLGDSIGLHGVFRRRTDLSSRLDGQFEIHVAQDPGCASSGTADRGSEVRVTSTSSAFATGSDVDFRMIADSLPHLVWIARLDGSPGYVNQHAAIYAGSGGASPFGWDWLACLHPDDAGRARMAWELAVHQQTHRRVDCRIRRGDGVHRWHTFQFQPMRDQHGTTCQWLCTATDIDDAKAVEADLRTAERHSAETLHLLEGLQSDAPVGFGFVDRNFRIRHINATLAAVNGGTVAEYLGKEVSALVPQMWPVLEPLFRQVVETGEAILEIEIDGPLQTDPAGPPLLLVSFYPLRTDHEVIGIGFVVVDITARKLAEKAVKFQSDLLAAAGQAIVAVNLDRNVIYWNRAAEEMYGWSAAEAIGRPSVELIVRHESPDRVEVMLATMLRGERWSGDYEVTRRDGSNVWVFVTNTPLFDDDGQLLGVIGSSIDVTERKMAEAAGRQLAAIIDGSGDAIFGSTVDGLVTSWNPAAEALFGFTALEIIGRPSALIASDDRVIEQVEMRARLIVGGAPEHHETVRRRKDGSLVDVLITASGSRDASGRVVGFSIIAQDITERISGQRALVATSKRLAEAQRIALLGSFEFEAATGEETWSDEYYRILGLDTAVTPTTERFMSAVHPDDLPNVHRNWTESVEHGGHVFDMEFRIVRPDMTERWVRTRGRSEVAADGTVARVVGTMMDDTERVAADRVRRSAGNRFEIGFEQSAIGASISDLDGIPVQVNSAACLFFGRPPEQLIGARWTDYTHPDEVPLGQAVLSRLAAGHDTHSDERRYIRPDGSVVWALTHVSLVRDEDGEPEYFFMQLQDITGRKMMEQELAHQALHDTLTGLPNRALLTDRLVHGLAGSRRRGAQLGVMFLDIDQFKLVNDSLGHSAGDELLQHVAVRISAAIRPGDTVARFGGDEFVVVCDDVSALETEQVAARVLAAVNHPWHFGEQEMHVTASLGIAIADETATPESLLRDSDSAMYRAKELGRGRIELFDAELRLNANRRLATASALHRALERGEFVVQYQPVIDLVTGAMVSAEALVRWRHPEHGLVTPGDFIALAEETGLIVPIGARVLEQACLDLAEWQRLGRSLDVDAGLSIAVNLSVRQMLSPDICGMIDDVLVRTGVDAGALCLELTESVFMGDAEYFGKTLNNLKALGVDLSIDDFGTGYSSLSYLKLFPVDAVKVDRVFVDGLGTDPHDTALVAAIVAMASALELEVTAEGVETYEQLLGLKSLGVTRAQGFYFARPTTADAISRLVAKQHHWNVS
jgi:diguanylate cyclase (GGDEF)-like protein/PAS domain S-box-containing protein